MPPFHFRVQPVLDRRLAAQKEAEEELARHQKQLLEQKRVWSDLQQAEKRIADRFLTLRRDLLGNAPVGGQRLQQRKEDLDALGQELLSAREGVFSQKLVVEEAELKVNEARVRLAERSRDAETLAKYREKLQEEWLRENSRKEELELDEIGNTLYLNRNRTQ
jgi:hypothetical protein